MLVGIPMPDVLSETIGTSVTERLETSMTGSLMDGTSVSEILAIMVTLSETIGESDDEIFVLIVTLSETVGTSMLVGIPIPNVLSETVGTSVGEILALMETLSETVGASFTESAVNRCLSSIDGVSVPETLESCMTGSLMDGTSVGKIFALMVTLSETAGASTLVGITIPDPLSETDGASVTEKLESRMTGSLMDGTSRAEITFTIFTLSDTVGVSTLVGIAMPEPPSETDGASVTERLETSFTESLMDGTSSGAEKSFLVITLSDTVGASLTESAVNRCLSIIDGISVTETITEVEVLSDNVGVSVNEIAG